MSSLILAAIFGALVTLYVAWSIGKIALLKSGERSASTRADEALKTNGQMAEKMETQERELILQRGMISRWVNGPIVVAIPEEQLHEVVARVSEAMSSGRIVAFPKPN